jgi:hypothetical protein
MFAATDLAGWNEELRGRLDAHLIDLDPSPIVSVAGPAEVKESG